MASPDQIETFCFAYRETHDLGAAIDAAIAGPSPAHACARIIRLVCTRLDVTPEQLLRGGRHARIAGIRHVAMWVCREATLLSYPEIAEAFGGMHHSSVMHGCEHVERKSALLAQAREILETAKTHDRGGV